MNAFHSDEGKRIAHERCAGIVVKEDKILLMHRIKNGYEYWVIPGGSRQNDEFPTKAVEREIEEETNIQVDAERLIFEYKEYDENKELKNSERFYICEWKRGEEPCLNGEEKERSNQDNFFEPKWVNLSEVRELNILPVFAKDWILKNLY